MIPPGAVAVAFEETCPVGTFCLGVLLPVAAGVTEELLPDVVEPPVLPCDPVFVVLPAGLLVGALVVPG